MSTKPNALRFADELDACPSINYHSHAAELRRLHKAHDDLRSAVYWVIEGGEFANWVIGKEMPLGAMKEYDALIKEYANGIPT